MAGLTLALDVADQASPRFRRVGNAIARGDLRRVLGRAGATALRKHFSDRDTEGNRLGGKRTHYWGQVRRSVQQPELYGGDGVKIAINQVGFAQKVFGGRIEPVEGDWLTIPARAEAHGKRAREFNDLHFVFFHEGLAALIQNEQTSLGGRAAGSVTEKGRERGETTGGGVFFWLVDHVDQKPDPEALPPESEFMDTVLTAGADYLDTLGGAN